MRALARKADLFTTTYRAGVNKRFGLQPAQLAEASERGIVCMTAADAYGSVRRLPALHPPAIATGSD
jgi:crotonobetainyl-CoA:carnitine CoA-transferase CaiB-like acyl-CoA transferase